jgi:hypothetical protein
MDQSPPYYYGVSSLLFIISAVKSIYSSKLILYKISNCVLIVASYLCNSTNNKVYLFFDYITICAICFSYLNHYIINGILLASLIYEYNNTTCIVNTKNISFGLAITKAIYNTYILLDNTYTIILVISAISGIMSYEIRYYLLNNNINNYTLFLTWWLHFSIMYLLYIISITAV